MLKNRSLLGKAHYDVVRALNGAVGSLNALEARIGQTAAQVQSHPSR